MRVNTNHLSGFLLALLLLVPASAGAQAVAPATRPPDMPKGLAAPGAGAGEPAAQPAQPSAADPARPLAADPAADTAHEQRPAAGGASLPSQDANFMMKAANSGHAEVELATLALERAKSERVKQHAQRMLEAHRSSNERLQQIAADKAVPLPDQLTGVHRNLVEQLRKEEAADFDEAYMQAQVGEHKAAVALFRDEKNEGTDPQLRDFAAAELPKLEQHLQEALSIAEDIIVVGPSDQAPPR